MCAKDTALFSESISNDPVWTQAQAFPHYAGLYHAARRARRAGLVDAGKSPEQRAEALSHFDWAYNTYSEAGGILLEDRLDDRILHSPTCDRVLERALRRLTRSSHAVVRSLIRRHVRPVALELARTSGSFASFQDVLRSYMALRNRSVTDLAREVGLHPNTLRSWLRDGILPTSAANLQRVAALERILELAPGSLTLVVNGPRPRDSMRAGLPSFDTLGEALQHFIELRGRTETGVASDAGVGLTTLRTWLRKDCRPRRDDTMDQLARVEKVLNLPQGTLLNHTDGVQRYMTAVPKDFGLSRAVWGTVRSHLPDDFDARSPVEQAEIVTWVMETIWKAPRDEDDAGGMRDPYRCRFKPPAGRSTPDARFQAPAPLQAEYDALLAFKTSHPAPLGKQRGAAWREGTVAARTAFFSIFFGAVREVDPDMPPDMMSFLNGCDEGLVRRVIEYIVERRGHPTTTIEGMIHALIALFNCEDGFVVQHRHLMAPRYSRLPEGQDFEALCQETITMLYRELDAWKDRITAGRSSFAAVDPVLRDDTPLDVYHTIVEHIDARTPSRAVQEMEWARCQRRAMLLHFLEILPLRRKDATAMLFQAEDVEPPSYAALTRMRAGILYFRKGLWRFRQPEAVFKNHGSPAISNVDVPLVNWREFYDRIDRYLAARTILLNGGPDFGQFIVKDNTQSASSPEVPLGPSELSDIFVDVIRKYGIHNPYTGSGAIVGLRVHRPQSVRHVVATHLAKVVGYHAAAARLFDTEEMVRAAYADYTAGEKFEDADVGYAEDFDALPTPGQRLRKRAS